MEPQAERRQPTQGQPALERIAGLARGSRRRPGLARSDSWRRSTAPSVRSLWPPIILVTECTTRLAPCSIGRQMSGENVLSTTSGMPASRATVAMEPRSATRSSGFEIVSVKISRVVGCSSDLRAAASDGGVEHVVPDTPARQEPGRQGCRLSVDSVGNQAHDRSGSSSARKTAAIAPMPEAQIKPASPPSRRASFSASWAALGWPSRA